MTLTPRFAELDWPGDGGPRSRRFGDVYFSLADGLAESRAVFLAGCGLPEAWAGRRSFVVGELGFGSGLNILALLDLWRRTREPGARLHVFSTEAFPLTRADAARAHAAWAELADLSATLLSRWPEPTPGYHRIDLPALGAVVDLGIGEAGAMLADWDGRADAWFLDGFAPAANPEMWREDLMALVAQRSAAGARAATFTVAGAVRRALAAAGFVVEKRPGHGRKRERLEATLPGAAFADGAPGPVVVVGAGVAGAACARALRALGADVTVLDDGAGGASGNPAALVTPALDAAGGDGAALAAQALRRAADIYRSETPAAVLAEGVLRLEREARDVRRLDAVAAQALWRPGAMRRLDSAAAGARLGEPLAWGGLDMADALVVEPGAVIAAWLDGVERRRGRLQSVEAGPQGVRLRLEDGGVAEAARVVLAGGWGLAAVLPDLPLRPVRGQVTLAVGAAPTPAASWGGYAAPARAGVLFGATHDRDDPVAEVRAEDDRRNLEALARTRPALAAALAGHPLQGRAGVRAVTRDHRPLCGRLAAGAFLLAGLGGRGFTYAPLLGEHLAAAVLDRPSPLPRRLAALVAPGRASLASLP